jgi:hypothetical protein
MFPISIDILYSTAQEAGVGVRVQTVLTDFEEFCNLIFCIDWNLIDLRQCPLIFSGCIWLDKNTSSFANVRGIGIIM